MTDIDIDAIRKQWLAQCGPCDAGLPMSCSHPDTDYRPTVAALCDEVEQLTADVERLRNERIAGAKAYLADVERLGANVTELTAALAKARAELADVRNQAHRRDTDHQQTLRANTELANEKAQVAGQQYLIWSHKQNAWWGPNGGRYFYDVTSAGRYTLDRANDHASTRSWPADRRMPPEVVIPAPPGDILNDPERCGPWLAEQIKAATEAKIAARRAQKTEVAR